LIVGQCRFGEIEQKSASNVTHFRATRWMLPTFTQAAGGAFSAGGEF